MQWILLRCKPHNGRVSVTGWVWHAPQGSIPANGAAPWWGINPTGTPLAWLQWLGPLHCSPLLDVSLFGGLFCIASGPILLWCSWWFNMEKPRKGNFPGVMWTWYSDHCGSCQSAMGLLRYVGDICLTGSRPSPAACSMPIQVAIVQASPSSSQAGCDRESLPHVPMAFWSNL